LPGREVALKLLPASHASDGRARDQVEREARIIASLNHPNVLALHDVGLWDGAMYIVTELIDGESLRGWTAPLRKSLDIAARIADGLSAAHAAGCEGLEGGHDGQAEMPDELSELL
jgi:eukaryotic-like serine/threonine-protein kinase